MVVIMKDHRGLDKVRVNHSREIPDPILSIQTKTDYLWEKPEITFGHKAGARWLNK